MAVIDTLQNSRTERMKIDDTNISSTYRPIPTANIGVGLKRFRARQAMNAEEEARSPLGPNRDSFLSFAKACYVRASSSSRKGHGSNNPPAGNLFVKWAFSCPTAHLH